MGTLGRFGAHDVPRITWTEVPSLGISVHARTWSGGPQARGSSPVVLVHGLGLSSRYMIPLGQRLAMLGYDALAPDLPGFGRTPRPAGSTPDLTDALSKPTVRMARVHRSYGPPHPGHPAFCRASAKRWASDKASKGARTRASLSK